jgi:chromosome segregation ATPase
MVGFGGNDTWVLLDGHGTHVFSGSWSDAEEAKRLRGSDAGPFLYYRTGRRTYVTRDPAVIDRVKAEMKEQRDLGEQQAALGAEQAALGGEQAGLGAEQGQLGARQHELAAAMAARGMAQGQIGALEGALAALETHAAQGDQEVAAARKALREAIESLKRSKAGTVVKGHEEAAAAKADRMREVSDRQRELGRLQAELGAKQAALGKRQAELGQKQRLAAEAARKRILTILEEARAAGRIETVK